MRKETRGHTRLSVRLMPPIQRLPSGAPHKYDGITALALIADDWQKANPSFLIGRYLLGDAKWMKYGPTGGSFDADCDSVDPTCWLSCLQAAAMREAWEETGLSHDDIEPIDVPPLFISQYKHHAKNQRDRYLLAYMPMQLVRHVKPSTLRGALPVQEMDDFAMLPLSDLMHNAPRPLTDADQLLWPMVVNHVRCFQYGLPTDVTRWAEMSL